MSAARANYGLTVDVNFDVDVDVDVDVDIDVDVDVDVGVDVDVDVDVDVEVDVRQNIAMILEKIYVIRAKLKPEHSSARVPKRSSAHALEHLSVRPYY